MTVPVLSKAQLDGLACVVCGSEIGLMRAVAGVASASTSQLFAHVAHKSVDVGSLLEHPHVRRTVSS